MGRIQTLSICLYLCFLSFAGRTVGADYPRPIDNYINDFAGILKPADVQQLRNTLETLEREKWIAGTIVTVQKISDYGTGDGSIEAFATNLFNSWGVGDKTRNNGFMVIVAVGDRRCRIELGRGWGRTHDANMKNVIDQKMVPHLKTGDFSGGVVEGVSGVIAVLTGASGHSAAPEAARQPSPKMQSTNPGPVSNVRAQPVGPSHGAVVVPYLIIIVVAVALVFLFKPLTSLGDPNQQDHIGNSSSGYTHYGDLGSGSGGSGGGFGGGSSSGGGASGGW